VVLSRFGGDEFVVLHATGHGAVTVEELLDRLRDRCPLRWSAGSAPLRSVDAFEQAMRAADEMLSSAKADRGRRGSDWSGTADGKDDRQSASIDE
jgi:GGDEF domain-containing protein